MSGAVHINDLYTGSTKKFTKGPGLLDCGAGFTLVTKGWADKHDLEVVPMVS